MLRIIIRRCTLLDLQAKESARRLKRVIIAVISHLASPDTSRLELKARQDKRCIIQSKEDSERMKFRQTRILMTNKMAVQETNARGKIG